MADSTKQETDAELETTFGYYYSKGALDFRDKLLAKMGALPPTYSALEAYYVLLDTFPDPPSGSSPGSTQDHEGH